MRVKFTADFDWTPPEQRGVTYGFLAGQERTVKRECGEAAVAAGAAEEVVEHARTDVAKKG